MNRDRLLADAKAKALALAEGYAPPAPLALALPGPAGAVILQAVVQGLTAHKIATEHDTVVAAVLSDALTGGSADPTQPVGAAELLELERVNFERLLRNEKTRARIAHTLATGRPLRN